MKTRKRYKRTSFQKEFVINSEPKLEKEHWYEEETNKREKHKKNMPIL